ncbi:hypothetical protein M0D73_03055 [Shewanella putrefaciens]|nr:MULTISPECIES: hypothetical protein [unclassified Shewanella]MCK7628838.1 hypothetical protein [Shewanella sp. JNE9-1]MCK7634893.1 hypothetical protein [Shewanella sp. JNE17]MCK7644087.1 hypothetical protein [Shewanella sp. JNE3-1]MCK7650184.1 hypothetical protein [Shewanella sp. JNE8]MCK7652274.1 hypothetical protein [Shewanella sp. JNE4-1]
MSGLTQFIPAPHGNFAGDGELLSPQCQRLIPKDLCLSDLAIGCIH